MPAETAGEKGGWGLGGGVFYDIEDETWFLICVSNTKYVIYFTIYIYFDWHVYVYCLQHRRLYNIVHICT